MFFVCPLYTKDTVLFRLFSAYLDGSLHFTRVGLRKKKEFKNFLRLKKHRQDFALKFKFVGAHPVNMDHYCLT
jgi:hypothetical protein